MKELVTDHIRRSIAAKERLLEDVAPIVAGGQLIVECFRSGGKLLCCGNGGSAADAQHIATEFLIRYSAANERGSLPALSLAADSSALTAAGNDFGFEHIFARQIEGLGQAGDLLLAITTSGNSPNVLLALEAASQKGLRSILLSGKEGGRIVREHASLLDVAIIVPEEETARIQECHIMIGQIFCALAERELYGF